MKEQLRGSGSVLKEVGTQSGVIWIGVHQWAAVVFTWVIKQNGKFRNQGSRQKFGSISYPNLRGFTVSFVPFPKETFSDPPELHPPTQLYKYCQDAPTRPWEPQLLPSQQGAQSQKHNAVWWCNCMVIPEKGEERWKNVINLYPTSAKVVSLN